MTTATATKPCTHCAQFGILSCAETVGTCGTCQAENVDVFLHRPSGETLCLTCLGDGKHLAAAHPKQLAFDEIPNGTLRSMTVTERGRIADNMTIADASARGLAFISSCDPSAVRRRAAQARLDALNDEQWAAIAQYESASEQWQRHPDFAERLTSNGFKLYVLPDVVNQTATDPGQRWYRWEVTVAAGGPVLDFGRARTLDVAQRQAERAVDMELAEGDPRTPVPSSMLTGSGFLRCVSAAREGLARQSDWCGEQRVGYTIVSQAHGREGESFHCYKADAWQRPVEQPLLPWAAPSGTPVASVDLDGAVSAYAGR